MSDQWLSIVEYARTFAMSDMTIRRRIKTGKLQAVLKEGKYFIPVGTDKSGKPVKLETRPAPSFQINPPSIHGTQNAMFGSERSLSLDAAEETFGQMLGQAPAVPNQPQVTGQTIKHRVDFANTQARSSLQPVRSESESAGIPGSTSPSSHYESGLIPGHIRLGIQESNSSLVDSKALLDFCESVLRRFSRLEARLEEGFKSKVALLENQMVAKDQENNKLRQQIEDLQLLIKILERGSISGKD